MARPGQADHMGPDQAVVRLGNYEVAVFCVSAQTIGFEILVAVMADGDALFRTGAFCRGLRALGFDGFSRRGFGGGVAWRRFFLRGGLCPGPRFRLVLGPLRSPLLTFWETLDPI